MKLIDTCQVAIEQLVKFLSPGDAIVNKPDLNSAVQYFTKIIFYR